MFMSGVMDIGFWNQKWSNNETGFHLQRVNPHLTRHWNSAGVTKGSTVFVPMCGKSLDMLWLSSQGYDVVAVECSELAIQQFMSENRLNYRQSKYKGFKVYTSTNIRILQGDYFLLSQQLMEGVSAIYDRASLVAMSPDLRQAYVDKLVEILPGKTKSLLITLEYDQRLMAGPPFSVSKDNVYSLFNDQYKIIQLESSDILEQEQRFRQRGLDYLTETIYLLDQK